MTTLPTQDAAVTAEEAKDAASILVSWCPADRQGPFDVVMRYIEQTSRATRLAAAPRGWKLTKHADGAIVVWKDGLGGYAATKDHDSIAVAVLWELANDMLDAAPAASSPEVADERGRDFLEAYDAEMRLNERESVGIKCSDAEYFQAAWKTKEAAHAFRAALVAGEGASKAIELLRDAHDTLAGMSDSDLDWFEDEEEEREAVPAQYAARKVMQAIELLTALAGEPAVAAADEGREASLREIDLALAAMADLKPMVEYGQPGTYDTVQARRKTSLNRAEQSLLSLRRALSAASQDEHQEKQG